MTIFSEPNHNSNATLPRFGDITTYTYHEAIRLAIIKHRKGFDSPLELPVGNNGVVP